MRSLQERLKLANTLLAPYAVPHEGLLGRNDNEPEDDTRFPFQRDRDRIIHTQAFRRIKGKTQVFLAGTHGSTELTINDHVRTRLTHTLEVAQISRDIARALGLNEDLTECIALAHDLGHPPFGHAGEQALDQWMKKHSGSFEHNEQSHRIVTVLAEHSKLFPGLNLNEEILEGLLKHRTPHDGNGSSGLQVAGCRNSSLEAQVVNLADEIAYTGHDCEDGLRAELFSIQEIQSIPIVDQAIRMAEPRGTSLRGAIIHILVTDLLGITEGLISDHGIQSPADVYACQTPLAGFSSAVQGTLSQLREFLWKHMYLHPDVMARSREGQAIIDQLCEQYMITPDQRINALMKKNHSALPEAIKDYVSGMTDAYAKSSVA